MSDIFDEAYSGEQNLSQGQNTQNSMSTPITQGQVDALGMGVSGVGQLAGGIYGMTQQKKLEEKANTNLSNALSELDELKGSQPSLATPGAFYEGVKQAYDQRLMQMRMDDINRSLATTTQAASQFGARGLGALAGATAQAARAQKEEALTQQRLQSEALMQLGQAEMGTMQMKEARSTRDLDYAYDAKAMAEAQVAQAEQQRMQNWANVAGGLASVAGSVVGLKMQEGGKVGYRVGPKEAPLVTEGEFNHDTNKKAVIDEESGQKEAELTGGEYVFNPEQSEMLFKLAQEGDSPLHKYLLELLLKFEQNG